MTDGAEKMNIDNAKRKTAFMAWGRAAAITFCLILAIRLPARSTQPSDTSRDERWRTDLRCLVKTLSRVHKNAFFQTTEDDFRQAAARLNTAIPTLREHEIVVELARLVAMLGDAHTALSVFHPAADFHFYPISFTWFKDGLYVTMVSAEHKRALGVRLLRVGDTDIQEACATIGGVISHENEALLKSTTPSYLATAEVLHALGLSRTLDRATFGLEDAGGRFELDIPACARSQSIDWLTAPNQAAVAMPLYMCRPKDYYWYEYLPAQRAVYFQYNRCKDMPAQSFAAFAKDMLTFADENQVDKFIVDLRWNGGGNSMILEPLIQGLRRHPSLNRPGHLFVIIGRKTFSSAILNALDFRNKTKAVLVGEPTGGRPNHYGEVKTFTLPCSGLVVSYSTKYFRYAKDDTPSLMPDVTIELSAADFFDGQDPVLDAILAYQVQ